MIVSLSCYGDANLDSIVDDADQTRIENGIANGLTGWTNGDFSYSGSVDDSDIMTYDCRQHDGRHFDDGSANFIARQRDACTPDGCVSSGNSWRVTFTSAGFNATSRAASSLTLSTMRDLVWALASREITINRPLTTLMACRVDFVDYPLIFP